MKLSPTEKQTNRQIGERLRRARHQRELTQQQLGAALGVSFQQIQKYENGHDSLSAARIVRLAEILTVSINHFYDAPGPDGFDDALSLSPAVLRLLQDLRRIEQQQPPVFRAIRKVIRQKVDNLSDRRA
jgi:transcriptional regulator with XRE-family HTH domain